MATAESVAAKLQALITTANATTGKTDADLTTAIDSLVAGFGGGAGLDYDIGEFTLDANCIQALGADGIPHQLGEVPRFVLVWSEEMTQFTEENPNSTGYRINAGYLFADGLFGFPQRLSGSITTQDETFVSFAVEKDDYSISAKAPNSMSYAIDADSRPTADRIALPRMGSVYTTAWFAGITYKYFVSPKWWTTGQEG